MKGLVIGLAIYCAATSAFAWGDSGHRIVGEIAWMNLTPKAKDAVAALLPEDGEYGGSYNTLAAAATWPDSYVRGESTINPWVRVLHYIDAESSAESIDLSRDSHTGRCVINAILQSEVDLRGGAEKPLPLPTRAKTKYFKDHAILFLGHFVGDVHQPLHVAHPDDEGGNSVHVSFFRDNDNGKLVLHKVWDTSIIERYMEQDMPAGTGRGPAWKRFAKELDSEITATQRREWSASLDPVQWANESLDLSRQHTYRVPEGGRLGPKYYEECLPVIKLRLQQGGIRLAAMLNHIYE